MVGESRENTACIEILSMRYTKMKIGKVGVSLLFKRPCIKLEYHNNPTIRGLNTLQLFFTPFFCIV